MLKDLEPSRDTKADTSVTVVFVFYDADKKAVLVERRKKPGNFYDNKLIYPGGSVRESEAGHFEEALTREIKEELSVTLLEYKQIPAEGVYGETGKLLVPFLITRWSGEIPSKVKDTESELIWEILDTFEPELESMRKITYALRSRPSSVAQS